MVVNLEFYAIALVVILLSPQRVRQKWEWEELSCKGGQLESGGHASLFARSAVHGFPVLVRRLASTSGLGGCADGKFIHRRCHAKAKAGGYVWQ